MKLKNKPSKKVISELTSSDIVKMIEKPFNNGIERFSLERKLAKEFRVIELRKAMRITKEHQAKALLCDVFAIKKARSAIPELLECLDSKSINVQENAAEALGKIGSQKTGEKLQEKLRKDPDPWFAIALGAIKYEPAIPDLITSLQDKDSMVRGAAAWSLGVLIVEDALCDLEKALAIEKEEYSRNRMVEAIEWIQKSLIKKI